jgi:hypothetical protein
MACVGNSRLFLCDTECVDASLDRVAADVGPDSDVLSASDALSMSESSIDARTPMDAGASDVSAGSDVCSNDRLSAINNLNDCILCRGYYAAVDGGNRCVNFYTDPQYCGADGVNCRTCDAGVECHLTVTCIAGTCRTPCLPGYEDCNGRANDGCESSLSTTINCGVCGNSCSNSDAGTSANTCADGGCRPTCISGFGNCDRNGANGCEANLNLPQHCGSCEPCPSADGGTASFECVDRTCVPTCASGWVNCDGDNHNGCETRVGARCNCAVGRGDCDNDTSNGCEVDVQTDRDHCGRCLSRCIRTAICISGGCSSCPAGQVGCGTGCQPEGQSRCSCGNRRVPCSESQACTAVDGGFQCL